MAAKLFEVGDILPATTRLRIYFNTSKLEPSKIAIKSNNGDYLFYFRNDEWISTEVNYTYVNIYNVLSDTWVSPFNATDHNYIDLNVSSWSLKKRTISLVGTSVPFTWEDLNAPQGFSITFEENGGSEQTDLTEQTQLPNPLPTPTKSGYTFRGWYYDSDFTNEAFAGDSLSGDVTLYAKWQENYRIFYNTNGGSSIPQTSDATQLPNPLPIPTKSGHIFVGWYYDSDFTNEAFAGDSLTGDVTLYAKWGLTSGKRIFQVGDVLPATTQLRISWGSLSIVKGKQIRTNNDTLVLITRSSQGHIYIRYGITSESPRLIYDGYDFIPPFTSSGGGHAYYDIDTSTWDIDSRTISRVDTYMDYFYWEVIAPAPSGYTITFNSNGGTTFSDIEEATQLPNPLPIPTKSGSVFVGWYYESTFTTKAQANDVLTADVTLYAKWYDLSIGKLYKGDVERSDIQKIYKGTTLLYEKEEEPSGYDITFSIGEHATSSSRYNQFYSIDDGTTWVQLTDGFTLLVDMLNNINMIKFKIRNAKIVIDNIVFADRLNDGSEFVTDNYTLTKDADIYVGVGWLD